MTDQQRTEASRTSGDSSADPFERELRHALEDAAAEPAPERFVARIARIPREGPRASLTERLAARSGFIALGDRRFARAVAAVAVIVVALFGGTRLLGQPPGPGGVDGSPQSSAAADTPSPAPSLGGPAGGPVPAGFQPISPTFTSAADGWILGSVPCADSTCTAIVRTTDGGASWTSIPAPTGMRAGPGPAGSGVASLRFADPLDGWAFGRELLSTHDGGATWRPVTLPGMTPDGEVMALEVAGGFAHAVYFAGSGASVLSIATSPVATDDWVASPTTVEIGAGPVPDPQLVLSGAAGWLIEVDRVVVAGARLVDGAWVPWQPPCASVNGPATLAAASASDLVVACDEGLWSTPTGVHVYFSSDGGLTFVQARTKVPVFNIEGVAAPAPGIAFVAGSLSGVGSAIVGSFDGGMTWSAVHVLQGAGSLGLTFVTADVGVAIATPADGSSRLLMTHDGGRTWSEVPIAGD